MIRAFSKHTNTCIRSTAVRSVVTGPPAFPPGKYDNVDADTGISHRPIFVAATKQHVGKTTVSLALMSGLQKRFDKVGFIKPVGQQHVSVKDAAGNALRVDKDVVLMREHFGLGHVDYAHMSPVIIPSGYTKRYIDGEINFDAQLDRVHSSMQHVHDVSDTVLIEGTGHVAVGSVVGLNNAKVASQLGASMVLIANGGLGKAFDELELNRNLCEKFGVNIAGVIINKVLHDKYEQTKEYMEKALMDNWGIPLLGCVPDRPFLGCPALADLEHLFGTSLLSGEEHRLRHYTANDINVIVTNLTRFLENLREKDTRTLYICHCTRDDLIVGFLGEYERTRRSSTARPFEAALLICGRAGKYVISPEIQDMMRGVEGAPIMSVQMPTQHVMKAIMEFTPKLNIHDTSRVDVAVDHYEKYIDYDLLLKRTSYKL
eukprot:Nitzschia sp. Nitz4//scaffold230_size58257//12802//14211//NITZ4_006475-RA/size58257-augustus-gene-0.9-mRNA-1//-1//CDS//3329543232//5471//frame0